MYRGVSYDATRKAVVSEFGYVIVSNVADATEAFALLDGSNALQERLEKQFAEEKQSSPGV